MNEQENPFKYRHEAQFEKDTIFLKLFASGIIELIPEDSLMKKATIFLSTPGGGKSSLFRVFKPNSLITTINYKDSEEYSELFTKLKERNILTDIEPKVLGIYLSCARNYDEIEFLNINPVQKKHLFFSLINARVLLIALQGMLLLKELAKEDLDKINIEYPNQVETLPNSPFPCNGKELHQWASNIENSICDLLDSYEQGGLDENGLSDSFDYLHVLNPENITIDGEKIFETALVMLDDVQFLSKTQQDFLYNVLKTHQIPLPIWLADRRETLDLSVLMPGNDGREFTQVIIEDQFRSKGKTFENLVKNIASKRTRAGILELADFTQCVDSNMMAKDLDKKFKDISIKVRKKIEIEAQSTKKFNSWILDQENKQGTQKDKAVGWRSLEISVQRNLKGVQTQLFDIPLEVEKKEKAYSQISSAAEYLLNEEYNIPYFYGFSKLASLASYNVEQFIEIAGDFFDEIISKSQLKHETTLTPYEQETLIKKIARKYWNDIPRSVPNGILVSKLVLKICTIAHEQTIRPTAPYLPGVTGIGITELNYSKLHDVKMQKKNPHYSELAEVIQSCIAYNILRPEYDYKQGPKGTRHVVLQLNRLLCVHFGMPLGYGGWRAMKLDSLVDAIDLEETVKEKKV